MRLTRYLNERTGAATLSLFSNSLLIILKIIVGLYTGSVSIISEAIHSSTDLLAAIIAFLPSAMQPSPPIGITSMVMANPRAFLRPSRPS